MLFGVSAALTPATLDYLHESVGTMLALGVLRTRDRRGRRLRDPAGLLGTGRLAPSVATVSVANPVVSIAIGVLLLTRLSVGRRGISSSRDRSVLALFGAVVISLAHESRRGAVRRRSDGRPAAAF